MPEDAPEGLCPNCVLKAGLQTGGDSLAGISGGDPTGESYVPPTPAELSPLFPDLEILELVGRGGMGMVYKARQKHLDRFVALKILLPSVGKDPAFASRFNREARAMAMLSHPRIVTVYEFGEKVLPSTSGRRDGGEGGFYYFLMEFIDGLTLRQLLDAGKLTSQEALAIVPQICEALQFAHDKGVVHRDIKPENILMDRDGQVKIADFGLAKLVGKEGKDLTKTGAGQVMGTPNYMAPEQIEHPQEVDHRADIYSLGVVFYQMLTGELPIGRFASPSKKVQIDVRLDEVVLRALEKEPEQRYQQASDIKSRLETIATTRQVSRSAVDAQPRLSKTALVGALWGGPLFAVIILSLCVITLWLTLSVNSLFPLLSPILVLLLATPIGVPILGYVALKQIRHSAGRLYGLGLALFDLLAFPLLALDAVIAGLGILAARASENYLRNAVGTHGGFAFAVAVLLMVVACVGIDFLAVRGVWRAVNRLTASAPVADQAERAGLTTIRSVATPALAFVLGVLGFVFLLTSLAERFTSARARIRTCIFETDTNLVDQLVPEPTRTPAQVVQSRPVQTAEVSAEVFARLLADGGKEPGLLDDQTLEGTWWPKLATTSHYMRQGMVNGNGWIDGFLGIRRQKGALQLLVEESVMHGMNSAILWAGIAWEGSAPGPEAARAFFIPFSRLDGTSRYLVIAFQVGNGTQGDERTRVAPPTAAVAAGVKRRADLIVSRIGVSALTGTLPARVAAEIEALDGVESVCGGLVSFQPIEECGSDPIVIQGWAAGSSLLGELKIVNGRNLSEHDHGGKEVVVGKTLADLKTLRVGQTATINDEEFHIAGVFESAEDTENSMVIMLLDDAQRISGEIGQITGCTVKVKDTSTEGVAAVRAAIEGPIAEKRGLKGKIRAKPPSAEFGGMRGPN